MAIGEEADMADAMETVGHGVRQDAAQGVEAFGESRGSGQGRERAGKAQFADGECCPQPFEEQRTEPPGEKPRRQEEPRPARDPSRLVGRQTAARDDAVRMRVMVQVLAPGVQHGDRADLGAEMPRVGAMSRNASAAARNRMA